MSDRALAKKAGVTAPTIAKARAATVNDFTVDKRVGLDGKKRSLRKRITDAEAYSDAMTRRRVFMRLNAPESAPVPTRQKATSTIFYGHGFVA
jgi:hypothetical protein